VTSTNKKTLSTLALPLLLILAGYVAGIITFRVILPSVGLGIHVEVTATWADGSEITEIDWDIVESGVVKTLPTLITVTNIGNQPVTLELASENLVGITINALTWNYDGTVLLPTDAVNVQLSLDAATLEPTFSFDVVITAVQQQT